MPSDVARTEHGDFQTPHELANEVVRTLARLGVAPRGILEPTCGEGSLLVAALEAFPTVERAVGVELQPRHARTARAAIARFGDRAAVRVADAFATDWDELARALPDPLLVVGNPPWVTSAALGALASRNRPARAKQPLLSGLDALTGKSNFDLAEWTILHAARTLARRKATIAMLCKTSTARRVLLDAFRSDLPVTRAATFAIDARSAFGAATTACLLVVALGDRRTTTCDVHDRLDSRRPSSQLGFRDGTLVRDARAYDDLAHLRAPSSPRWRSGVKHDCAPVLELSRREGNLVNGRGEPADVEDELVFPLAKGGDLARGDPPSRFLLVPQTTLADTIDEVRTPRGFRYLRAHERDFLARKSAVYRDRPFSIFGIGAYTFAPWKVAVSSLHRELAFRVVGPHRGRPVVLDDTCYFVPCATEGEASRIAAHVARDDVRRLIAALTFPDGKRAITADVLNRLALAPKSASVILDHGR